MGEPEKIKINEEEKEKLAVEMGLTMPKNMSDKILNTITSYEGEQKLTFPKGYQLANSLKTAYIDIMGDSKTASCTPDSIANSILQMAILGLSPAQNQVYFIPYGNKLQCMPSYFGRISVLKRIEGVEDVNAQVIYKGDTIDYEVRSDGSIYNIKHVQKFENIDDDNIIGGYAVVTYKGKEYGTIATMKQIQQNWEMSKQSKNKTKFRAEFVKRTMINKGIKWFINTTNSNDIIVNTFNETVKDEYVDKNDYEIVKEEQVIDID